MSRNQIMFYIVLFICACVFLYETIKCTANVAKRVKSKSGEEKYYYILRDGHWYQQVGKAIYDAWPDYKMISNRELTEDEMELW